MRQKPDRRLDGRYSNKAVGDRESLYCGGRLLAQLGQTGK